MVNAVCILLFFSMNMGQIPKRNLNTRDYIIAGQNTAQKIYYSTGSSYSKLYSGEKAMDSDTSTSWISKESRGPHWIEIDFGIKRIMTSIVVYIGKRDNYRTIKYCILQFMYEDRFYPRRF
jgi:hypothetical protein